MPFAGVPTSLRAQILRGGKRYAWSYQDVGSQLALHPRKFIQGDTVARARELGLHARAYVANNDSHRFFQPFGDLIITMPTKTNVNDLAMVFVF